MLVAVGNLWTYPAQVVVITTNGIVKPNGMAVMGAGNARQAFDLNPGIAAKLGMYITQHGNRPFNLGRWNDQHHIATFPTKHERDPSDPTLIHDSALLLRAMANKFGWESIVMPRPGCGLGGLSWPIVKAILQPILDDRFTVVSFKE